MSTFVLVHGGWVGAWSWRFVRPMLRKAGHEVFTPSLSGWAERAHLGSEHINQSTSILDVQRLIEYEDLSDIVLVGHSSGGMAITGVADRIPARIGHLIYLDAFFPANGECILDHFDRNLLTIEDWRVLPLPFLEPFEPAVTAYPIGICEEPVHFETPLESHSFSRSYIKALQPPRGEPGSTENFWEAYEMAKASPLWTTAEIDAAHMALLTDPELVTSALLELTSAR